MKMVYSLPAWYSVFTAGLGGGGGLDHPLRNFTSSRCDHHLDFKFIFPPSTLYVTVLFCAPGASGTGSGNPNCGAQLSRCGHVNETLIFVQLCPLSARSPRDATETFQVVFRPRSRFPLNTPRSVTRAAGPSQQILVFCGCSGTAESGPGRDAMPSLGVRLRRGVLRRYRQVPRTEADGAFSYSPVLLNAGSQTTHQRFSWTIEVASHLQESLPPPAVLSVID